MIWASLVHMLSSPPPLLIDRSNDSTTPSLCGSDNGIGDEGATAVAAAVLEPRENNDKTWAFNTAMNRLWLTQNDIGDDGAKALAAALEPRKSPDGCWVFNRALNDLRLHGKYSCAALVDFRQFCVLFFSSLLREEALAEWPASPSPWQATRLAWKAPGP